jgi:hypothetical protein
MEANEILSGILSVVLGMIVIASFVYLILRIIWHIGNRNAENFNDYEKLYKQIQDHIRNSSWGELVIRHEIKHLKSMSYKNPEKTHVIEIEFLSRYKIINDMDEFSPEQFDVIDISKRLRVQNEAN